MDGTCTGEHGIGQGKMAYLETEVGSRSTSCAGSSGQSTRLDIMNPGKIVRMSG